VMAEVPIEARKYMKEGGLKRAIILIQILFCSLLITSCGTRYGGNGKLDIETNEPISDYSESEPKYYLYKKGVIDQLFHVRLNLEKTKKKIKDIFLNKGIFIRESTVGQRNIITTTYKNNIDNVNINRVKQTSIMLELVPEKNNIYTEITINAVTRSKGKKEDNWFKDNIEPEKFKENYQYLYDFIENNQ
jgi:hypothetical protein